MVCPGLESENTSRKSCVVSRILAIASAECIPRSSGKYATVFRSYRYGQVTRKKLLIIRSVDQAVCSSERQSNRKNASLPARSMIL